MLAKLMKHDLKKMTKILIIMYIISLAAAGITRLINIGKNIQIIFILGQVFSGITYSAIANVLVNTFIHIIKVFISNLYKDESYLTHTLPVKKNSLLLSKYLSSLIVIISSVLVCFISLFILFYSPEFVQGFKTFIEITVAGFNISVGIFVMFLVLIIFAQICAMISMAFTSIVIANKYNHKRILKGILWFALFYFSAINVVMIAAVVVFTMQGNISQLFAEQMNQTAFLTLLIVGLIVYILYAIVFYFICRKSFNKGVNVD